VYQRSEVKEKSEEFLNMYNTMSNKKKHTLEFTSEAQYDAHFQRRHCCPTPPSNSMACIVLDFPFLSNASREGNISMPPKGQRVAALHA